MGWVKCNFDAAIRDSGVVIAMVCKVKCNFDAAIRDLGVVIAMVCRTNDGSVIQAWTELLQPGKPIWGEGRAVEQGRSWEL
jgi:hypothetical protein